MELVFRKARALNVFMVIGPTGAGKTTLLTALRTSGFFPPPFARIYNDDGSQNDEGELLADAGAPVPGEEFEPLMSGCFGCYDQDSFFNKMDEILAAGYYTWVVIDPLGFVSGGEATGVIHEWAARTKVTVHLKVLGVLNVAEIKEACELGVLDSQLAVANVGIALNRVPQGVTSVDDERLAHVFEVVDAAGASAPVFLLSSDLTLPSSVEASVRGREASRFRLKAHAPADHDHSTCCGHDHDDDHAHGHAQHVRIHFLLRPELNRRAVMEWFDRYFERVPDHGIFRMKGATADLEVHRGFRHWGEHIVASTTTPFVTLYVRETGTACLEDFVEIMAPAAPSGRVHGSTKELLRRTDLPPEQNNHLVRWIMDHLPKSVAMVADGPVTNPELLELLNEIYKRPGVDPQLVAEALQRRVGYFLACVDILQPESGYWNAPGSAVRKHALGVAVGWYCWNKRAALGGRLYEHAVTHADLLLVMLAEGAQALSAHHSDSKIALQAAGEMGDAVRFYQAHLGSEKVRSALSSPLERVLGLAVADARPGLVDAWEKVTKLIS